jgi:hypothetical protein
MKISIIHSSHKRKVQQLRQIATDLQFTSSEIPKKLGNQQFRQKKKPNYFLKKKMGKRKRPPLKSSHENPNPMPSFRLKKKNTEV